MKKQHTTDILILGAGIGGFETFRTLSRLLRRAGSKKVITIVDKNNYFTFVPMMHEVATGSIEPTHASIPLRELVYNTPHHFQKAEVQHIDPKKKCVTTSAGTISYTDACVIALGSKTNYFGTPGAQEHSYHVRTLEGAMRLKRDVLTLLDTSTSPELAITHCRRWRIYWCRGSRTVHRPHRARSQKTLSRKTYYSAHNRGWYEHTRNHATTYPNARDTETRE